MKAAICSVVSWILAAICVGAYFSAPHNEDETLIVIAMRQNWIANAGVAFFVSGLICLSLSELSDMRETSRRDSRNARNEPDESPPEWLK